MADKQGKGRRRLPQWYLDKVNMAADVFAGNPDLSMLNRPHVKYDGNGTGVQATRKGYLGWGMRHSATQQIGKVSLTQPGLPLLDLDDGLGVAE